MIITDEAIAADPRYTKLIETRQACERFYRTVGAVRVRRAACHTLVLLLLIQIAALIVDQIVEIDLMFSIVGATAGTLLSSWQNLRDARREFVEQDRRCDELSSELITLTKKYEFVPFGMAESKERSPN